MYLKEMQLRNYKNFDKARFIFQKGINVIIGENDSGKTNALHAIRLVLDKHMNWYEREISENMFSQKLLDWRGQVMIISLRFAEIDTSKEDQSMLKYITGNKEGEGSLTLFCLPDTSLRKKLSGAGTKEEIDNIISYVTIANYSLITTCGADADYLNDDVYERMVGKINCGICNWKERLDDSLFGYVGSDSFNSIEYLRNKIIDFTYIDALRDAVKDMKQRYNPLMSMLRQIEPRISEKGKVEVKTLIDSVNSTIGDIDEISKLSQRINGKIVESVGNTYAPNIILRSELSGEIKDIFRNLKLKSFADKEFNLENMGLGSTNIIYIALKLMEYSFVKELDDIQSKYFLLLFEEPEAHLHKHIQMALFDKTGINTNEGVQVIMTTHSLNISAASKISTMNIIKKCNNISIVMQPCIGLSLDEVRHIERYFDVKRSELLFSKSVILVEGDAEEIMIPIIVKKCLGVSLDELGISLINIGSVGFSNVYKLFHDTRIKKKCAIITDIDTPLNATDKSQINAYNLGIKRKEGIELESTTNIWISGFYALHTFEVDIVNNNEFYIKKLIDKTYKDNKIIKQKKEDISSKNIEKYGDVAIKLANYNKKGWNAILLSELIDGKFQIPDYILSAILFAGENELLKRENVITMLNHYGKTYEDYEMLDLLTRMEPNITSDIVEMAKEKECAVIKLLKGLVKQDD